MPTVVNGLPSEFVAASRRSTATRMRSSVRLPDAPMLHKSTLAFDPEVEVFAIPAEPGSDSSVPLNSFDVSGETGAARLDVAEHRIADLVDAQAHSNEQLQNLVVHLSEKLEDLQTRSDDCSSFSSSSESDEHLTTRGIRRTDTEKFSMGGDSSNSSRRPSSQSSRRPSTRASASSKRKSLADWFMEQRVICDMGTPRAGGRCSVSVFNERKSFMGWFLTNNEEIAFPSSNDLEVSPREEAVSETSDINDIGEVSGEVLNLHLLTAPAGSSQEAVRRSPKQTSPRSDVAEISRASIGLPGPLPQDEAVRHEAEPRDADISGDSDGSSEPECMEKVKAEARQSAKRLESAVKGLQSLRQAPMQRAIASQLEVTAVAKSLDSFRNAVEARLRSQDQRLDSLLSTVKRGEDAVAVESSDYEVNTATFAAHKEIGANLGDDARALRFEQNEEGINDLRGQMKEMEEGMAGLTKSLTCRLREAEETIAALRDIKPPDTSPVEDPKLQELLPKLEQAVAEHDRILRSFDVKIQSLLDPVRRRLTGAEESVKSLFVSMTDNADENRENIQALQTCVEKSAQATEAIINSLQISRGDGTSGMAASVKALESALEDSMEATERTERGLKNVEVFITGITGAVEGDELKKQLLQETADRIRVLLTAPASSIPEKWMQDHTQDIGGFRTSLAELVVDVEGLKTIAEHRHLEVQDSITALRLEVERTNTAPDGAMESYRDLEMSGESRRASRVGGVPADEMSTRQKMKAVEHGLSTLKDTLNQRLKSGEDSMKSWKTKVDFGMSAISQGMRETTRKFEEAELQQKQHLESRESFESTTQSRFQLVEESITKLTQAMEREEGRRVAARKELPEQIQVERRTSTSQFEVPKAEEESKAESVEDEEELLERIQDVEEALIALSNLGPRISEVERSMEKSRVTTTQEHMHHVETIDERFADIDDRLQAVKRLTEFGMSTSNKRLEETLKKFRELGAQFQDLSDNGADPDSIEERFIAAETAFSALKSETAKHFSELDHAIVEIKKSSSNKSVAPVKDMRPVVPKLQIPLAETTANTSHTKAEWDAVVPEGVTLPIRELDVADDASGERLQTADERLVPLQAGADTSAAEMGDMRQSLQDLTLHGETLAHQLKEAEDAITFLKQAIQAGPRRAREASPRTALKPSEDEIRIKTLLEEAEASIGKLERLRVSPAPRKLHKVPEDEATRSIGMAQSDIDNVGLGGLMSTVGSTGCVVDPAETVEVLTSDVSQDVTAENSASFSGFSDSTAAGSVLEPGLANRLTCVERQIQALSGLVNKERERSQGLAGSLEAISEELDRWRSHQYANAGKSADDMKTSPLSETLPREVGKCCDFAVRQTVQQTVQQLCQELAHIDSSVNRLVQEAGGDGTPGNVGERMSRTVSTTLETVTKIISDHHHDVQTCIDEWASKLPKTEDPTVAPKVFLRRPPSVPISGTASSVIIGSAACSPRSVSGTCSQGCSVSTAPGTLLGSCRIRVTTRTASVHQDGARRHRSPTAVKRTARSLGPPASQQVVVSGPGNDCADRLGSAVWSTCPACKEKGVLLTGAPRAVPVTRQISRSISRSVSPGPRRAVSTRPTPPLEALPTVTFHSFPHPSGHVGGAVADGADLVPEPVQLPPCELVTLQSVSVLERMQAFEKTPRLRSGRVAIPPLR
uniref:Uncharacterized protein n=1 Tax=Noctiluca scintillans TaxID=2966 RepID=A0A7S1AI53_NOCSC